MTDSVVVVGASLGGLRTAEALRKGGYGGSITVLGDEPHLPYNRPPLSKDFLASRITAEALDFPLRPAVADVSWVLGTRVEAADLAGRRVTTTDGRIFDFGTLVVATGLRPRRLAVPGAGLPGCVALRSRTDAEELRAAVTGHARVVVVGAGFIGCEVASTLQGLGAHVTVVGRDDIPLLRPLGRELATGLLERNRAHGVQFVLGTDVTAILGEDRVTGVRLGDGTVLDCDVVVEAIGSVRNTEWLAGNDIDIEHGVRTDSGLRALRHDGRPWESVFAVGDVARFPNDLYGVEATAVEHWNIPTETAKRAAEVIIAAQRGPEALRPCLDAGFAPVPSFWSDQFDAHLLAYGMLGYADRSELLHGDVSGDCVFGYFRGEELVGVCGVGSRSLLMTYRGELARRRPLPSRDAAPTIGAAR